jgi:hypothetical protein
MHTHATPPPIPLRLPPPFLADEEGTAPTLAYAISADGEGPVAPSLVKMINDLRGIKHLLYKNPDGKHSNFLQTLRAIEKAARG